MDVTETLSDACTCWEVALAVLRALFALENIPKTMMLLVANRAGGGNKIHLCLVNYLERSGQLLLKPLLIEGSRTMREGESRGEWSCCSSIDDVCYEGAPTV